MTNVKLLTGNANPLLAQEIAKHLNLPITKALVTQFSDGETRIDISESLRDHEVLVLQSTSTPANQHLMELLLMIDAIRRASALHITAVIPYFGYSRQDTRNRMIGVPISAKVVADLLATVGIDRVVTFDLHSEQLQGFFSCPIDNLSASKLFIKDVINQKYSNIMVVSPDVGGVVRARAFAKELLADLAIIDKRRPQPNETQVMNIINDVKNRTCVMIDDMVDTGKTLALGAEALKKAGAKKVVAYCTHPVLSGKAIETLEASPLDELVVTNTIVLNEAAKASKRIRQLSIASVLADAIR